MPKSLRLQAIVDTEGRLREPVLVAGMPPGMVYQMLEAMRDWRYEPARKGKKPVAIFRLLSFDLASGPATAATSPYLSGVEELLREGNWKGASEEARKAWTQAFNAPGYSQKSLASLLSLRAVADAGMGMESQAACRWQAAQHLDPSLLDTDLSPYGAAGALLAKSRREEIPSRVSNLPEMQKRSKLSLPHSAYWPKLKGSVRLGVTVDAAGRIRQPTLLGADGNDQPLLQGLERSAAVSSSLQGDYFTTLLAAGALDSACNWQMQGGTYEPFRTVLTVPFRVSPDVHRGTQFVGPRTIGLVEPTLRGREGNPQAPWGTTPPKVGPPN